MAVSVLTGVKVDAVNGIFTALMTTDASSTASGIYCGFTPRVVKITQVGGTPGVTALVWWYEGMTAGYNGVMTSAGAVTIPTSNGITPTTGPEATVVAKATGSPAASGPGFVVGSGAQTASLVYMVEAYR